jgi:very-short-patch-repair endonuclease
MNNYNLSKIQQLYEDGLSLREIAVSEGLAPNTIKRILTTSGITIRTRGEQQSVEFKRGKRVKGIPTEETKNKISIGTAKAYAKFSQEKKEELVEKARERWYNIDEGKRKEMMEKAHQNLRESAEAGSKLEVAVLNALLENQYDAQHHITGFIPNAKLEVDILIPSLRTAIEIDGVSHFLPIWGEEKLVKTISADMRKAGLLLSAGYNLLRIKCLKAHTSQYLINECVRIVTEELEKVKRENIKCTLIERELK